MLKECTKPSNHLIKKVPFQHIINHSIVTWAAVGITWARVLVARIECTNNKAYHERTLPPNNNIIQITTDKQIQTIYRKRLNLEHYIKKEQVASKQIISINN